MIKHLGLLLIVGLLVPSFAAAQTGAAINANAELGVQTAPSAATVRANAGATGTAQMKAADGKPTTTNATSSGARSGAGKPATTGNATSTAAKAKATGNATSTANKPAWGAKGGLIGFLKSLFGMSSASSTADLRAEINASSTASTSPAQGFGFFSRIYSMFGIMK